MAPVAAPLLSVGMLDIGTGDNIREFGLSRRFGKSVKAAVLLLQEPGFLRDVGKDAMLFFMP